MAMRVLVTGARGQLGTELRRCLEAMGAEVGSVPEEYRGVCADFVDFDVLDVSDECAVRAWFSEHGPYDVVVNCAAATNVDGCEADEARALRVNSLGARNLAVAVQAGGGKLVHVSTDYVFSCDDPRPRREDDPACPVSAYGRSKWAGELLARDACERTFVVRTAWLYGYVGRNFVKTVLRLAREHGVVSVVADQYGSPTSANDLACAILRLALTEAYGTYHCVNDGVCSWFDFACAVVDLAGVACEREPLTSDQYRERFPESARRPAFSALDAGRLEEVLGGKMRPWRDALATYVGNLEKLGD